LNENDYLLEFDKTSKELAQHLAGGTLKKKRFTFFGKKQANSLTAVNFGGDYPEREEALLARGAPNQFNHTRDQWTTGDRHPSPQLNYSQARNTTTGVASRPIFRQALPLDPHLNINRLSSAPEHQVGLYTDFSLPRRKSLPSIVKEKALDPVAGTKASAHSYASTGGNTSSNPAAGNPLFGSISRRTNTYVVEDGAHKLVTPTFEEPDRSRTSSSAAASGGGALSALIKTSFKTASGVMNRPRPREGKQFTDLYRIESPESVCLRKATGHGGSQPDVSAGLKVDILPREAVYMMSQQRREQLIRERADRERRQKNHIIISFEGTAVREHL